MIRTALMPCRVPVDGKPDGAVRVSWLKSLELAGAVGGTVAKAIGEAGGTIDETLEHVIERHHRPDEE